MTKIYELSTPLYKSNPTSNSLCFYILHHKCPQINKNNTHSYTSNPDPKNPPSSSPYNNFLPPPTPTPTPPTFSTMLRLLPPFRLNSFTLLKRVQSANNISCPLMFQRRQKILVRESTVYVALFGVFDECFVVFLGETFHGGAVPVFGFGGEFSEFVGEGGKKHFNAACVKVVGFGFRVWVRIIGIVPVIAPNLYESFVEGDGAVDVEDVGFEVGKSRVKMFVVTIYFATPDRLVDVFLDDGKKGGSQIIRRNLIPKQRPKRTSSICKRTILLLTSTHNFPRIKLHSNLERNTPILHTFLYLLSNLPRMPLKIIPKNHPNKLSQRSFTDTFQVVWLTDGRPCLFGRGKWMGRSSRERGGRGIRGCWGGLRERIGGWALLGWMEEDRRDWRVRLEFNAEIPMRGKLTGKVFFAQKTQLNRNGRWYRVYADKLDGNKQVQMTTEKGWWEDEASWSTGSWTSSVETAVANEVLQSNPIPTQRERDTYAVLLQLLLKR